MVKTIRKGAIVTIKEQSKESIEIWGDKFEVWCKEGNFVKLISLKKACFGVCMSCGIDKIKLL